MASASATHPCSVASEETPGGASTSTPSQDNPQAGSSAESRSQTQSEPGTSMQWQPAGSTPVQPHQVDKVKADVVLQQNIQTAALITQHQLQARPQNPLQPPSPHRLQGNLIQIEPQPLAQAPAQPPFQALLPPQVAPVIPPAVLIAAAPERLGPPGAGHRIVLGSQPQGEAVHDSAPQAGVSRVVPPAHALSVRVANVSSNPPAPPVPIASVPSNGGEARLVLAPPPNAERVNAAPGLVAVPPAPEDIPQIEDARPGPSVPRETAEQEALVRRLISGVVSIRSERKDVALITWFLSSYTILNGASLPLSRPRPIHSTIFFCALQLDLFPDVQEACVAELITKNNVKDLNV